MTTEKFIRRSQIIAQHLTDIALHSEQIEVGAVLRLVNPHFRAVLSAQEHLLNAVERLLEKLPGRTVGL